MNEEQHFLYLTYHKKRVWDLSTPELDVLVELLGDGRVLFVQGFLVVPWQPKSQPN